MPPPNMSLGTSGVQVAVLVVPTCKAIESLAPLRGFSSVDQRHHVHLSRAGILTIPCGYLPHHFGAGPKCASSAIGFIVKEITSGDAEERGLRQDVEYGMRVVALTVPTYCRCTTIHVDTPLRRSKCFNVTASSATPIPLSVQLDTRSQNAPVFSRAVHVPQIHHRRRIPCSCA